MKYELVYILTPKLGEDDAKAAAEELGKKFEEKGATMVRNDFWGRRTLAYEIDHLDSGFYILAVYEGGPDVPKKIEDMLRIEKRVLRHLNTKYENHPTKAEKEEIAEIAKAASEEVEEPKKEEAKEEVKEEKPAEEKKEEKKAELKKAEEKELAKAPKEDKEEAAEEKPKKEGKELDSKLNEILDTL